MLSRSDAKGIKHVLCGSNGRGLFEAHTQFPPHLALVPFLFANSALYPFAVINLSHEHDYMLSPMSLLCKSPNLRGFLGTRTTGSSSTNEVVGNV